jgi:hypothetical protein
MATKIITLSYPSLSFTNNIDWSQGKVFETRVTKNLSINFTKDTDGKRIIISLTNITPIPITITWPSNVTGSNITSLEANQTATYSLTKIGTLIYASKESSTPYAAVFTSSGTLTIPSGVTTIYVDVIPSSGGGGGGGGYVTVGSQKFGGSGGGGGGYATISTRQSINVNPTEVYNVNIGAAGAAGTAGVSGATPTNGGDGGNGGTTTIIKVGDTLPKLSVLGGNGGKGGISGVGLVYPLNGGVGGELGGNQGGTRYSDMSGGLGGIGGANPDYSLSKGGNGGSGGSNAQGVALAGSVGTSAIVLISYA